jgi:flagellar hook protein FlgE
MNSVSSIAGSALSAYGIKQAVTANNVANIETPDFKSSSVRMQERPNGGVQASVMKTNDSVDISKEAVNMISNSHGFKANIKTIQTHDEMTKELLNLKA